MGDIPLTEEQLWKDGKNNEPKEHQRFKQRTLDGGKLVEVVDLFCGGGGFSTGAIAAGAKVVLAIDCWQPALDIHHANHPTTKTLNLELGGSLVETAILIREHLTDGAHFHLHGSPPCQALSIASSRDAEEGMVLVNWFIDLVEYMNPDSWSMENVPTVAKKLDKHRPNTPYVKLNSANFGVPQTRNRIFAGEGWKATPTHTKEEWVSVIEALPHLVEELALTPAADIVSNTDGCGASMSRRAVSVDTPINDPIKTIHNNPISIRNVRMGIEIANVKMEAMGSNAKRQNDRTVEEPAKTICGSGNQVGARLFNHEPPKAVKIRSLSLDETKILQGFPASYLIPYKRKTDAWTVLGNVVCPPIAQAIIRGLN